MNPSLVAVLTLLGAVIVMFAMNRPRMDAVALLAICALPFTGVVGMSETLAGFGDPNVVLIAALFVIGEGLVRTGVARHLGDWVVVRAGPSEPRLIALLMGAVCALGATMSSTAVTAIFIPVVLRICRRTGVGPGRLMMPLSMAALISGMTTLVATTPNLVVHSELVRAGHRGFGFFSFTPFGVPILALGIGYVLAVRRWLPSTRAEAGASPHRPTLAEWVQEYGLAGRTYRLRVAFESPWVGQTLESIRLRGSAGIHLVALQRGGEVLQPVARTMLLTGDVLVCHLLGPHVDIDRLQDAYRLELLPLSDTHVSDLAQEIGMAELFVPAGSGLIGKTVVESNLRTRCGCSVIGLKRSARPVPREVAQEKLALGDTLLVVGPWKALRNVRGAGHGELLPLNLPVELDDVLPAPGRGGAALAVLVLVVGLMVSGVVPNVQAVLFGCLLMGALGCVDFESAYRAIDWKTIVLVVGMLPFSLALERTGGVEFASQAILAGAGWFGPRGVLALLFAMSAVLGLFISNTATAVLMTPVALAVADQLRASPDPFAMIVALASSAAFMTPVSSPVNTLVVTPGNYRFGDFVRIGVPFTIVVLVVCVLMVPWLLPL